MASSPPHLSSPRRPAAVALAAGLGLGAAGAFAAVTLWAPPDPSPRFRVPLAAVMRGHAPSSAGLAAGEARRMASAKREHTRPWPPAPLPGGQLADEGVFSPVAGGRAVATAWIRLAEDGGARGERPARVLAWDRGTLSPQWVPDRRAALDASSAALVLGVSLDAGPMVAEQVRRLGGPSRPPSADGVRPSTRPTRTSTSVALCEGSEGSVRLTVAAGTPAAALARAIRSGRLGCRGSGVVWRVAQASGPLASRHAPPGPGWVLAPSSVDTEAAIGDDAAPSRQPRP